MASKVRKVSDKLKRRWEMFEGNSPDDPPILENEVVPEVECEKVDTETKIEIVKRDVADAKEIVEKTIDNMVEREQKISELSKRAENLAEQSCEFKRNTEQVRRKTWCENQKMKVMICAIIFVIFAIIAGVIVAIVLSHSSK